MTMMRRLVAGLGLAAVLGVALAFVTGAVAVVETHGNSMSPRIVAGDAVVVRAAADYRVGDVVAYASTELHQTVLHRIVAIQDGRYIFRGDHNDFDDPEQPTRRQLIGRELIHIPAGGVWLERLTSPVTLGVLAFALVASGATVRTRRRRRRRAMAQHAAPAPPRRLRTGWSRRVGGAAAVAAVAATLGVVLGVMAWGRPTTTTVPVPDQTTRTMAFSYHADVPASPAYDGTRVDAPSPVFRKLADVVQLSYTYRGEAGTATVSAELSTASGWRSTVSLQPPVDVGGRGSTGRLRLDLDALESRAHAAAEVIGIPADKVDLAVVVTVETTSGDSFAPRLAFTLTPLQLTLADGAPALEMTDTVPTERSARTANTLGVGAAQLSVAWLRILSLAMVAVALFCLAGTARRRTAGDDARAIRRRYAALMLEVEPLSSPAGRPLVDVADFAALGRLAERYGLLVMHWYRSGVETFVVHDDGITYRYRVASERGRDRATGTLTLDDGDTAARTSHGAESAGS